jgi:hypothetical protein
MAYVLDLRCERHSKLPYACQRGYTAQRNLAHNPAESQDTPEVNSWLVLKEIEAAVLVEVGIVVGVLECLLIRLEGDLLEVSADHATTGNVAVGLILVIPGRESSVTVM